MKLSPLFSKEKIQKEVHKIAKQINQAYGTNEIVAIGILKGVFIFYTDLLKQLEQTIICDFCSLSFYGQSKKASSSAFLSLDIRTPIKGKQVLLIDCIADYGHSLNFAKKILEQKEPQSIKTACLIVKPKALKNTIIDFKGFQVKQDSFIVGYGIDYNNKGRNLNYLAQLEDLN
ncbi:MAG: phosphoribosyltransferase family protein [Oligoflexia bacterium]|nr:phosphoribosyltransferase family protein [Oligoflexia bacterium]